MFFALRRPRRRPTGAIRRCPAAATGSTLACE